ncbi:MAG: hypothetical protein IJ573_11180 [Clostridia bacterium]|nr:hypothetical protein [Clostridia bacterium]
MFSWLKEKMSRESEVLFNLLFTKNFDKEILRKELETGIFKPEHINRAAIDYVQECMDLRPKRIVDISASRYGETVPGYEDSHVKEALEVLLDYGLDPNKRFIEKSDDGRISDCWNIMEELWPIDNGYQAADTLYVLLMHGGNPNLELDYVTLIDKITDAVEWEVYERENIKDSSFDALVHYWLVLAGFNGRSVNGSSPLCSINGFALSSLRNHRDYSYEIKNGGQLYILDKKTKMRVARL